MNFSLVLLAVSAGLFLGILIFFEAGRRWGKRQILRDSEGAHTGTSAIDGAVLALLGLLLAFTFSGAASRFDDRRQLIINETNAIGTAYYRLSLLSVDSSQLVREKFRRYVDSRLEFYRRIQDSEVALRELANQKKLQNEIWNESLEASLVPGAHPDAARLLLPALNAMFDIQATRTRTLRIHPPLVIYFLLFVVSLLSAALAGYGMAKAKKRNWFHTIGFAVILAVSVYVIIDLEFPRHGLIRLDEFDRALSDLRADINP